MTSNSNSHKEIWDDSLLVDSWNEALEEYKYYHSINARGEKVETVLKESENHEGTEPAPLPAITVKGSNVSTVDHVDFEDDQVTDQPIDQHAKNQGPPLPASNKQSSTPEKGPAMPQHLIGQVQDENLKNLLMSWYYAGYYTGLYEGHQQGAAGKQA